MTGIPRWCWHNTFNCVVEIIGAGHFPSSAMAKLPNDTIIEVEISDLRLKVCEDDDTTKAKN